MLSSTQNLEQMNRSPLKCIVVNSEKVSNYSQPSKASQMDTLSNRRGILFNSSVLTSARNSLSSERRPQNIQNKRVVVLPRIQLKRDSQTPVNPEIKPIEPMSASKKPPLNKVPLVKIINPIQKMTSSLPPSPTFKSKETSATASRYLRTQQLDSEVEQYNLNSLSAYSTDASVQQKTIKASKQMSSQLSSSIKGIKSQIDTLCEEQVTDYYMPLSITASNYKSQAGHAEQSNSENRGESMRSVLSATTTSQSTKEPSYSSKFVRVKNAIITVQRLSNNPARTIHSVEQLDSELMVSRETYAQKEVEVPTQNKQKDVYQEALDAIKRRELLGRLCERGADKDVEEIKEMILNDPKKNLREPNDPEHFLNKQNSKGLTPLYIACFHGNLSVVKLLVSMKCNYMMKSKVGVELLETPLEVALRWQYRSIVEYLLAHCNFTDQYLQDCLNISQLPNDFKYLITSKMKRKSAACAIF